MNPPVHNLSQRLRALRKQWFKSQQAYANRCHELGVPITPTVIADWENSRSEIPARLVPFLAHTLNAQVNDLLPGFNGGGNFRPPGAVAAAKAGQTHKTGKCGPNGLRHAPVGAGHRSSEFRPQALPFRPCEQ